MNDAVAVGVGAGHRDDVYRFTVEMNGDIVAVSQYRQRGGRLRGSQPVSHPVLGKDRYTHPCKVGVASSVVAVHMGVDQKPDVAIRYFVDGATYTSAERCKLIIDHDDAIVADRQADISALPLEIMDRARDVMR